jgi:hypothetical protein
MKVSSNVYLENNSVISSWDYLVCNWTSTPVVVGTLVDGKVYSYVLKGVTRYRFVPDTYSSVQDAFYSGFNGTTLSDLICIRG